MARLEAKRGATQAVQLGMWEVFDANRTNMVALYDLAPRFVFYLRGEVERRKVIEREFSHRGKRYRITLKPTQLVSPDGTTRDCYLGEREQIVEEVIRRLAGNRSRLTLHGDTKVRFPFTLNEVRRELERVQHSYRLEEIREAITLLNEVRLKVEEVDGRRSPLLSAAAFPVMGMRKKDDGDDRETFVEFNPLVADAIRTLSFHQAPYDLLMATRDPVARWLIKHVWTECGEADDPLHQMTAMEIRRDSGMPEWKATRNQLSRITDAVQSLRAAGILEAIDAEEHKRGQRKEDITFTMTVSASFLAQARRAFSLSRDNRVELDRLSAGRTGEFVAIDPKGFHRLRDGVRRRALGLPPVPDPVLTSVCRSLA